MDAHRLRRARVAGPILAWFGAATCVLAEVLILAVDVESVVFTGPVLFIIGVLSIHNGLLTGYSPLARLGVSHCVVFILFVTLVNGLGWSPRAAATPFAIMGALYTLVIVPHTRSVARKAPPPTIPGHCAQCGYYLRGLRDHRCPECGTPFEPAKQPP